MMKRHPNGYYEMYITDKNDVLAVIRLCAYGHLGFVADVHVHTVEGIEQHAPGWLLTFDPEIGQWMIAPETAYGDELFVGSFDHALTWLDHHARLIANNVRVLAKLRQA